MKNHGFTIAALLAAIVIIALIALAIPGFVQQARADFAVRADVASANGANLTNLSASALASGTVPNARLDSDLQALAINNGASLTNLSATALASGTVPNARLDADLQTVAAKTLSVVTLTNVVYNGVTQNLNVVTWANP